MTQQRTRRVSDVQERKVRRGIAAAVLVMIVALVAITSAGCGSSASAAGGTLKVGQADNGKAYTVKVGDTIEVVIPGNPTTGFSWAAALAEKDAALIQQVGDPTYGTNSTDSSLLGAGGIYTFTFKAAAKGEASSNSSTRGRGRACRPEQTFAVTLTIK